MTASGRHGPKVQFPIIDDTGTFPLDGDQHRR